MPLRASDRSGLDSPTESTSMGQTWTQIPHWMQAELPLWKLVRRCANRCTSIPIWQNLVHSLHPMHLSFAWIAMREKRLDSISM